MRELFAHHEVKILEHDTGLYLGFLIDEKNQMINNELLLQASVQEIGLGVVRQKKGEELCSTRVLTAIGKD